MTSARHAALTVWEDEFDWETGEFVFPQRAVVPGASSLSPHGRRWISPQVSLDFAATELILSWNAQTPAGTALLVEARVRSDVGWSDWLAFGLWASNDPDEGAPLHRTTIADQKVESGHVAADTFVSSALHPFTAWQLRLTALRAGDAGDADDSAWPVATLAGGVASAIDIAPDEPASRALLPARELSVPAYSQRLHRDAFPQWDGGGQSWCSPTSTTMVLAFWGVAPSATEAAWVGPSVRAEVVRGVRAVFDADYGGAGNWAFNSAYAASRGLRAYVTRLRDLTEAEQFIAAGIPLVASTKFTAEELTGAGYSVAGHLMVIVGFTAAGDVIVNDPNSHAIDSDDAVRSVFRRDEFERVWLGNDGGLVYVMHPVEVAAPPAPTEANWVA